MIKSSSCFSELNMFLKENGDVYSFGDNTHKACGVPMGDILYEPTFIMNNKKIQSIILGRYHSFFLQKNGDLYGCGNNTYGQLGRKEENCEDYKFLFITSNVKKVVSSLTVTIIQKNDGKIFWSGVWREIEKWSFRFEKEIDIQDVKEFSCGEKHALFLKKNGEVWSIGDNTFGQSRSNTTGLNLLMKDTNIFDLCCGYNHSFILTRDERGNTILKCFGLNASGQLGIGHKNTEFDIKEIDSFPDIRSVHCGLDNTYILNRDGSVYTTGDNFFGKLGLGNVEDISFFTKIPNLNNIVQISTGINHTVFVNDNNEVFVCGFCSYLGLDNQKNVIHPTKLDFEGIKSIQNTNFDTDWTIKNHKYFPYNFKKKIHNFVNCLKVKTKEGLLCFKLPKPLLFWIVKQSV